MIGGRLLIWDVHRLVELAKPLPVKIVQLSSIREFDESFWFKAELPTCREVAAHAKLIAETDLQYPIILCADGRVMDGMHRVCKVFINNSDSLSAVQFEVNPAPDYINADIEALPYDEP